MGKFRFKKLLPGMEDEKEFDEQRFIININGVILLPAEEIIIGNPAQQHVRISAVDGVEIKFGDVVLGQWQVDGDIFIGSDLSDPESTYFSVFANAQTYNSESVGAGDLLIGDNSSGEANLFFDKSAGRILIRGGVSAAAYIDTDGSVVAGDGVVILDEDGVRIVLPLVLDPEGPEALKFVLSGGDLAAYVAGRGETGTGATGEIEVGARFTGTPTNVTALASLVAGDNVTDLDFSTVRVTAKHENSAGHLIELIISDAVVLEVNEDAVEVKEVLTAEKNVYLVGQGSNPGSPAQDADANLYIKDGKLVAQYDDGGTVRYKYLDLTGTGVTWVHTTTPP